MRPDSMFFFYRILLFVSIGGAFTSSAAWAQTCPQYLTAEESAKLDNIVGSSSIVVFGEPSHGLTAVHCFAAETFRYLVEQKHFRVFVFESAWGIDDGFENFMHSDRKEVTAQESFFLNAFNSAPILDLLFYVRVHNRKFPNDPIRIAGFQPEQPVTDFQAAWKYASLSTGFSSSGLREKAAACKASSDEFIDDISFIGYTSKRRRKEKLPTYTDEERRQCLEGLAATQQFLEKNREALVKKTSVAQFREAVLHVKSIRNYVAVLSASVDLGVLNPNMTPEQSLKNGHDAYEKGDAARFEVFQMLRETRYQNQKIFLWMHDWHAAKHSEQVEYPGNIPLGTHSVTSLLAEAHGKKLVVIGGIVGCPSCKENVPTDAIEKKFTEAFDGKTVFVDLRTPSAEERRLPLHIAGSLWDQLYKDRLVKMDLREQFDAVYYLPGSKTVFEK